VAKFTEAANYDKGGFSAYLNAAYERARGTNVSSAQFLFDPDEFAYIKKNWVFLDHDQRFTGSAGVSYTWKDWRAASTDFMVTACAVVLRTRRRTILT
jgi:hypothetical protein